MPSCTGAPELPAHHLNRRRSPEANTAAGEEHVHVVAEFADVVIRREPLLRSDGLSDDLQSAGERLVAPEPARGAEALDQFPLRALVCGGGGRGMVVRLVLGTQGGQHAQRPVGAELQAGEAVVARPGVAGEPRTHHAARGIGRIVTDRNDAFRIEPRAVPVEIVHMRRLDQEPVVGVVAESGMQIQVHHFVRRPRPAPEAFPNETGRRRGLAPPEEQTRRVLVLAGRDGVLENGQPVTPHRPGRPQTEGVQ